MTNALHRIAYSLKCYSYLKLSFSYCLFSLNLNIFFWILDWDHLLHTHLQLLHQLIFVYYLQKSINLKSPMIFKRHYHFKKYFPLNHHGCFLLSLHVCFSHLIFSFWQHRMHQSHLVTPNYYHYLLIHRHLLLDFQSWILQIHS